ncbi:MAG: amino acid ABC transporter permease [Clostridia bacterium]|nr:amino acid ABC transporter permease [Clostridia bacterium]
MFASGTLTTLELTLVSMFIGTMLGLVLALGRISKIKAINRIVWTYVWFFRGTPLLLQIMIVYYGVPLILKDIFGRATALPMFIAGCLALILNTGAYLAEIFRAGIESIDKGQMEAAKALGMSYRQAMFKVIIPQTIKRLIPPYSNEFTMILKDSSLVSVIGLTELARQANQLANGTGNWVFLFYAAGVYLFLTTISTVIFNKLEKRYSVYL